MTPILHHYPASPFAELVRAAFGLKGMAWQSVTVPNMMPKPGQTALTGGYGRTPVVQIGADIYCDTAAIIDALDALQPAPSFYPQPLGALHRVVAGWCAGPMFGAHVGAAMGNMPAGVLPQAFVDDRKRRFGFDMGQLSAAAPHLASQALVAAHWLGATLSDGRAYIGGDAAGHGDLALYANVWFVKSVPFAADIAAAIFAVPGVAGWFDRMAAFGHGARTDISADDAIAIAGAAEPRPVTGSVQGFASGQRVRVRTDGSGDDPVEGRLARCDATGITVLRDTAEAGTVAVHFPRIGQMVMAV